VTAVLDDSLQGDPASSGKERIAAALQAVAQDPLFVSLLRATQARRDEAFTDKGMKKTARDSPLRIAAERLREIREEKERLQVLVDESEGVEQQLRQLTDKRNIAEESLALAAQRLVETERLAGQAAELAAAAEDVRLAGNEVTRIQKLGSEVANTERHAADLAAKKERTEQALKDAHARKVEAEAALQAAQDAVSSAGTDAETSATVTRQRLELRRAAAEKAFTEAQQRKGAVQGAQKLVDSATSAERTHSAQETEAQRTSRSVAATLEQQQRVEQQLRTLDVLERALEALGADEHVAIAQGTVDKAAALRARFDSGTAERDTLQARRGSLRIPTADALTGMRRVATDLAKARGALDVGLLVTITPRRPLDIRVQQDDAPIWSASGERVVEIEAKTHVELDLVDVARRTLQRR
jgi:chromosome segregation ATPase